MPNQARVMELLEGAPLQQVKALDEQLRELLAEPEPMGSRAGRAPDNGAAGATAPAAELQVAEVVAPWWKACSNGCGRPSPNKGQPLRQSRRRRRPRRQRVGSGGLEGWPWL